MYVSPAMNGVVVEAVRAQLGWKLYLDMILFFLDLISCFWGAPLILLLLFFLFTMKKNKGKITSKMQIFNKQFSAPMFAME